MQRKSASTLALRGPLRVLGLEYRLVSTKANSLVGKLLDLELAQLAVQKTTRLFLDLACLASALRSPQFQCNLFQLQIYIAGKTENFSCCSKENCSFLRHRTWLRGECLERLNPNSGVIKVSRKSILGNGVAVLLEDLNCKVNPIPFYGVFLVWIG